VRRLFIASTVLFLSCRVMFAQVTPLASAMGATSPLGVPGATSLVGPVGIPLGSTELFPGGLSPGPLDPTASTDPCGSTGGAIGSSSTFDGSGINASAIGPCSIGTSSGTTPVPSAGGIAAGTTPGGSIPLGATEIDSGGVSPTVTPPVVVSTPSCGLSSSATATMSDGTTSILGSTPIGTLSGC